MQEFYPVVKEWVGERLEEGREKKKILKCLKAFGALAIKEKLKEGVSYDCEGQNDD